MRQAEACIGTRTLTIQACREPDDCAPLVTKSKTIENRPSTQMTPGAGRGVKARTDVMELRSQRAMAMPWREQFQTRTK